MCCRFCRSQPWNRECRMPLTIRRMNPSDFLIFKAVEDVFLSGPVMILSHELWVSPFIPSPNSVLYLVWSDLCFFPRSHSKLWEPLLYTQWNASVNCSKPDTVWRLLCVCYPLAIQHRKRAHTTCKIPLKSDAFSVTVFYSWKWQHWSQQRG